MSWNEDSRVKIPTVLHLIKLGFKYISKKNNIWDVNTNIFKDIFLSNIKRLNPNLSDLDIENEYDNIDLSLSNDDLGKSFYEKLQSKSGIRLIDFDDFKNNSLNVVTELTYKKDEDEFRPDITLLINGMPLVFIEVKKPNNREGLIVEQERIQTRFKNKKFKKFVNICQLIIFSNNMDYDDNSHLAIEGAFYATTSYKDSKFNYFREEEDFDLSNILNVLSDNEENFVLKDNNLIGIKNSPEFNTNKNSNSPTNRICTSLLQSNRLSFLLQYGFAYVKKETGIEKHIMRYPQLFATNAIRKTIDSNIKKGVIWHTQGSGKTALAYFSFKYLMNYFQKKNVISKYYFIVDRIDLLIQASKEFTSRGLVVHNIDSKEEFLKDLKSTSAVHNDSGKDEITVINIQKFADEYDFIKSNDYNINIQRVYFLDEVHRSYNPKGSFLANLNDSDVNSIKIGLTGTPLLGENNTRSLFGDYIHKYYYNSSILDGYTLRLIREEIDTSYKLSLEKTLDKIKILKGDINREQLYSHKKFVEPMLDYIFNDLEKSKLIMNNKTIGGMVVCDSSDQAKKMYEIYENKYKKKFTAGLILHDAGNKEERKNLIDEFKLEKIDILFVYRMLQTGFDCNRLKKIYIGRIIKSHNLLQTLTRVNRPYQNFRYGYVVDFADIQKEFDETNKAYFQELKNVVGDEIDKYSNLFKSEAEIDHEIYKIEEKLFKYNTVNAEIFSQQINQINDKKEIIDLVKILNSAKELSNSIRLSKKYNLLKKINFKKLNELNKEANNRLKLLNLRDVMENDIETSSLLNIALEDVIFSFNKIKQEEMIISDEYRGVLKKTRESLKNNFDQKDPLFVSLKEELERLFKKKNLNQVNKIQMQDNIIILNKILTKSKVLERNNQLLNTKYGYDQKYVRIHKRLYENNLINITEMKLCETLMSLKEDIDSTILKNENILKNESYVERLISRLIINKFFKEQEIELDSEVTKIINRLIVREYIDEFEGKAA
jgi:type I restriction enzyme, R subunit